MEFEFDPPKSQSNKTKHGIDLVEAQSLWHDSDLIEGPATSVTEDRWLAVGLIKDKHWTVCFTHRAGSIRIIECRRSRKEEKEIYELSK